MTFADWHSAVPDDQRAAGQSQWVNNYSECTVKKPWPQAQHSKAWASHGTTDKWMTSLKGEWPTCLQSCNFFFFAERGKNLRKEREFKCVVAALKMIVLQRTNETSKAYFSKGTKSDNENVRNSYTSSLHFHILPRSNTASEPHWDKAQQCEERKSSREHDRAARQRPWLFSDMNINNMTSHNRSTEIREITSIVPPSPTDIDRSGEGRIRRIEEHNLATHHALLFKIHNGLWSF